MANHTPKESGHETHVPTVDRTYLLMIGVILVMMMTASVIIFGLVINYGP
jgi:hypothetical protein